MIGVDLITNLPDRWKHDVTLVVTAGRDDRGDLQPAEETRISGCLLAVSDVGDFDNLNSQSTLRGRIFLPNGVRPSSTDQVITHAPAPVVGRWAVDGPAIYWPMGVEIRVEWEGEDASQV